MEKSKSYTTLKRATFALGEFDPEEKAIFDELVAKSKTTPNWPTFQNYFIPRVGDFYVARGLSRKQVTQTALWKIAQDLGGRILVSQGLAQPPDYRGELEELIREKFPSRRAFCEATGISEDMLSHVLARRKHLAVDTLSDALGKIGYELHIVPMAESST